MKDKITSRFELFLAKIAGRNVDVATMTPPVPSDMTELLMTEISERLDGMALPDSSNKKDKYLHTNADTGALEWSEVQSGGAFSVTITFGENDSITADKTPQEIATAAANGEVIVATAYIPSQDKHYRVYLGEYFADEGHSDYFVTFYDLSYLDHPIDGSSNGWVQL